MITGNDRNINI